MKSLGKKIVLTVTRNRRKKKGRPVNGILLLDKPAGLSSNQALQKVKWLFRAQKAGHTGNLDLPATGLLPICFGEATKMTTFLLDADKTYVADVRLGINTSTLDASGEIVKTRPVPSYDRKDLEKVLERFRGRIIQIPPMYSALKHQGEPLYKLAREGKEVERKERVQQIHHLEASNLSENGFTIKVSCSKGTYIRTLAEDIGEELGCGAHVLTLRRTRVGCFNIDKASTLDEIEQKDGKVEELDSLLLPVDAGLGSLPAVGLGEETAFYFLNGQRVMVPAIPREGLVRVYLPKARFLGIGEATGDGRIAPKRLISQEN